VDVEELALDVAVIRHIGSGRINGHEAREIWEVLADPRGHPEHAIQRIVTAIRSAAIREQTGTVGKRCTSILVVRGNQEVSLVDYHRDSVSEAMYYPANIYAKYDDGGAYAIWAGQGLLGPLLPQP
jgi:hypothetical protein